MSVRVSMFEAGHLRLLGAHVLWCADHLALARCRSSARSIAVPVALATPKSITFGTRVAPVLNADQHVRGLEVAVDHPFLMGVLDGFANDATNSSRRSRSCAEL